MTDNQFGYMKNRKLITDRKSFMQSGLALAALPRVAFGLSKPDETRSDGELWYAQLAKRWLEAFPVGNGRLGGMVFGGVQMERIALSDSTVSVPGYALRCGPETSVTSPLRSWKFTCLLHLQLF